MNTLLRARTLLILGTLGAAAAYAAQGCGGSSAETCDDLHDCPGGDGGVTVDGAGPVTDGTTSVTPDGNGTPDSPISTGDDDDGSSNPDTGVDATPPCDPAKTPAENGCVISDALAIFVSPTGSDTNAGTMEAPVKTLAHGVTLAVTASAHRVIACAATYSETLTLAAADDVGLQIFGGVTCPGGDAGTAWAYTGARAVAKPAAHGYALPVSGLTHALDIEDFEFDAQGGTAAGESSIAGFVSGSAGTVSLHRVKLAAGAASGVGTPGATPTTVLPVASNGSPGAVPSNGAQVSCVCANSGVTSVGGAGGTDPSGVNTGAGGPGLPALGEGDAGDPSDLCNKGGSGGAGANAAPVAPASGATTYATLSATGWTPSPGSAGAAGGPGQGGGGGASQGGTGGGGACGGCGGNAATPGGGGGSSIALLVFDSAVTFDSCTLFAGNATAGGNGAAGESAASGGTAGVATAAACNGGAGGGGAAGAASGGGAGGVSAGVVWTGTTAPQLDSATQAQTTFGTKGNGGTGGVAGTNDGKTGAAIGVLAL